MKSINTSICFKIVWVFVALFWFSVQSSAQTEAEENLKISEIKSNIAKCSEILYLFPDSALNYTDTILLLSKRLDYHKGLFKAHNLKGLLYWVTNEFDSAYTHYNKALYYSNFMDNKRSKAVVYVNLGLLFRTSYKNDSALTYMMKTLKYSKKHDFKDLYAKVLIDLGDFYLDQDNYIDATKYLVKVRDELITELDSVTLNYLYGSFGVLYNKVNKFDLAFSNLNKAIEIDQLIDDIDYVSNTYINIGELYFSLKNDNKSAVHYYRKAVEKALPYNKNNIQLAANINLGNVFLKQALLDSAYYYYNEAYTDSLIQYYPDRKTSVLVNLGKYYLLTEEYNKSRLYLEQGLKLSDSLNIPLFQQKALESLIKLDSIEHKYRNSVQRLKDYHKVSLILQDSEANNKIAVIEYEKYLVQEKYKNNLLKHDNELKNKLISNQKVMIWVILVFVAVLSFFLLIMYRARQKKKHLYLKLEKKNNQLQIVNNSLNDLNLTLKNKQELLKSLNITKDKFFSILGHDLKSPYSGLLGILHLMDNDWDLIEDSEKYQLIQSLHKTAKKNYKLLEELLSWGQMQQGLIKKQDEQFFLIYTINEIIDLYSVQIAKKRIKIINKIPDQLFLNSDPQLVKQILQNLIGNAIKFTPIGGAVTILTEKKNNKISIHVQDTGIGIPKAQTASIFNLDANYKRTGTQGEKSTGMGLILSNGYAEIIGADLSLVTEEGKGSSFILSLVQ